MIKNMKNLAGDGVVKCQSFLGSSTMAL